MSVSKYQLKILIWAINESRELMEEKCKLALDTASKFNLDVELVGIGHKFIEHKQRLWLLHEYLNGLAPDVIVVCMDGSDTLFNNYEHAILNSFFEKNTRILISAEKSFTYQYNNFRDRFDEIDSDYKYVNAGTFMGYVGDIRDMWNDLIALTNTYGQANDQGLLGIWAYEHLDNSELMQLDSMNEVFWVTTGDGENLGKAAEISSGIFNPNTLNKPGIIHCTGIANDWINKNFVSAYQNIINHQRKEFCRICIVSPLPKDPEYHLFAKQVKPSDLLEPLWYRQRHPNIEAFFYGDHEVKTESLISTSYFNEAILLLEEQYYFDYYVHLPEGYIIEYDEIYDYLKNEFFKDSQAINKKSEFPLSSCFIKYENAYYPCNKMIKIDPDQLENHNRLTLVRGHYQMTTLVEKKTRKNDFRPNSVISLGGWCGPAICLNELRIRQEAFPFDMLHSTPECINEVLYKNYEEFFKIGSSVVTPHHNLKTDEGRSTMYKRLLRFTTLLEESPPLLFIRVLISNDYRNSFEQMKVFMNSLKEVYNRENDKLVIVLKDQAIGTTKIRMLGPQIMVWAAEGLVGWNVINRANSFANYKKIINYSLKESNWEHDEPQLKVHHIREVRSRNIRKYLYDSELDKSFQKIKASYLSDSCRLFFGVYFNYKNSEGLITRKSKFKNGRIRNSRALLNRTLESFELPSLEFILCLNDICHIDSPFPMFTYLMEESDPRALYLFPPPFFHPSSDRSVFMLTRKAKNVTWEKRERQFSYCDDQLVESEKVLLHNSGIGFITNLDDKAEFEKAIHSKYIIVRDGITWINSIPKLFLSGACIIILTNDNVEYKCHYSQFFNPNLHFIRMPSDGTKSIKKLISKIQTEIAEVNGEYIASMCSRRAIEVFSLEFTLNYLKNTIEKYCRDLDHNSKNYSFHDINDVLPPTQYLKLYEQI